MQVAEQQVRSRTSAVRAEAAQRYREKMLRQSCTYWASEKLRGPPAPPFNGRFMCAPHHAEWDGIIKQHDKIALEAYRDGGKCTVGESLIPDAGGRLCRADQWVGGLLWAYDPNSHRIVPTASPPSRRNGVQPCLRIRTRTGRTDVVTLNHQFRLWDRWARADELRVGQRIAAPRVLPVEGGTPIGEDAAWLLGVLVGDGGLTGSSVAVTNADAGVVAEVRRVADSRGWSVSSKPLYGYVIHKQYQRTGDTPVAFAREHGLMGKDAWEKRVPSAVFTAPNRDVASFLAGLFDTDGYVGKRTVELYSVAEPLLRQCQHLLSRLGIVSCLLEKRGRYLGEVHISWRLRVLSSAFATLARQVRLRGARGRRLQELARKVPQFTSGRVDVLPAEVKTLLRCSPHSLHEQGGAPRWYGRYSGVTREKVRECAAVEGNAQLLGLADGDVFWDEVVAIEDVGLQETWSLTVPQFANYVCNDIVTHNSFFWSKAFPLWKAEYHPGERGYIFSNSKDQAIQILGYIKEEIEENPKLQHLLPLEGTKGKQWSATSIKLRNGHRIFARGYGTKVRGAHPNWIVCDDVLNDEDMTSERIRNKRIDYFFGAITPMLAVGGQLVVIGTPFHELDLYGELKKAADRGIYVFKKYPALDSKGNPLFPERHSLEWLRDKRKEIGSVRFAREYLCEPISDEASLFPESLFRGSPIEQFNVRLGMPMAAWRELGIRSVYVGVDLAISASISADYTVIFVIGLDEHGNRWIMDIIRVRGQPYNKQIALVNEVGRRYEADLIFIEANQMQRVFGDELIRTSDLPIKKFVTTGTGKMQKGVPKGNTVTQNKNSLEGGIPFMRVTLENQKWRIPRGDRNSIERTDVWINEMRAFTWSEGKLQGVGAHDDCVMASFFADQAVRRGSFKFSTGNEPQYQAAQAQVASAKVAKAKEDKRQQKNEGDQLAKLLAEIEEREQLKKTGKPAPIPEEASAPEEGPKGPKLIAVGPPPTQASQTSAQDLNREIARRAWASVPGIRRF